MSTGVIYIATGKKFIDEACNSAASLRRIMPDMPLTIFCDEQVESAHFENVIRLNTPRYSLIDKILNISFSPYNCTLFLDTDTYACEDLSDLFPLMEEFDIAMAHAPLRASYQVRGVPDSFPEFNTGVILFKKSPQIMRFFSEWLNLYERDLKTEIQWLLPHPSGLNDQPTFREALYRSDLRIATLTSEYNCRFNFPGFVHHKVKIFHGRQKDLQTIARPMNAKIVPRVYIKRLGTLRVFSHPQPSDRIIDQVRWSLQTRGFWETAVVAKQRLLRR